jgi:hypothetical protein
MRRLSGRLFLFPASIGVSRKFSPPVLQGRKDGGFFTHMPINRLGAVGTTIIGALF